jgi:RNA polymerase sigma-70 factor (ECF subfamily)
MTELEQQALVERARAGDRPAREALAAQWLPVVHGVALARTGDAAAAEDLTQEAFLKAFSALAKLRDTRRFGPWLMRIVRNAQMDRLRRKRRERGQPLEEEPYEQPQPGESPVVDAWRALPEDQRLVCWLGVMQDQPLRAIAELLEISKSRAHRLMQQGLARMRTELSHVEV